MWNPVKVGKLLAMLAVFCGAPQAHAVCTFGVPFGGEPTLQTALNGLLSSAPNTAADCLVDGTGPQADAHWVSVSPTSATILLEIAGFANQNTFGIYDPSNPSNRLQIFSGPNGPGTSAALTFSNVAGGLSVSVTIGSSTWSTSTPFAGTAFGFYLRTPQNNVFFSNSDLNPGQADQMYAYRGNGASFVSGPIATDGNPLNDIFGATDVILAYEDLLHGDQDYQDFVVLVRGVTPVPLPAGVWLALTGLLGLMGGGRLRRTS
jgi:hypothetical protein